jgi:putative phage-type endonuclease
MPRDEWLELRRQGLGGSDAATVVGLNPYKSPLALYFEKRGEVDDTEMGEPAYWGIKLEDIVAQEFAERTGLDVRLYPYMLQQAEHDWMLVNLDRLVFEGPDATEPLGVLEVKTTGAHHAHEWADGAVPEYYQVQVAHELAVSGLDRAWIVCLVGGQRLTEPVEIERDNALIADLIAVEGAFWADTVAGIPPAADASESTTEALAKRYPTAEIGKTVVLGDGEVVDLLMRRADAKAALKRAKERTDLVDNQLRLLMGDAEIGLLPNGDKACTLKSVDAQRFDLDAFRQDHPDLAARYTVPNPHRRLYVPERKSA